MPSPARLGHARRLVIGFVVIAGVLTAALGWLAWRFVALEEDLDTQRIEQRLEAATDDAVNRLAAAIGESERLLRGLLETGVGEPSAADSMDAILPGSVILLLGGEELAVHPPSRLLYYPTVAGAGRQRAGGALRRADRELLAAAETLEFQAQDLEASAALLRDLVNSDGANTRAAAMLALGRVLRRAGETEAALDVYQEMTFLEDAWVEDLDLPAPLLGRFNRCDILDSLGRSAELEAEAEGLSAALRSGRWWLTASAYHFYSGLVDSWAPAARRADDRLADREALAAVVDDIWRSGARDTASAADRMGGNRFVIWSGERPFLVVEAKADEAEATPRTILEPRAAAPEPILDAERAVLVAGPRSVAQGWLADWQPFAKRQGVELALVDVASGRRVAGTSDDAGGTRVARSAEAATPDPSRETVFRVIRTPDETGLPWSVHVTSADPASEIAGMARQRNLLLAGLALVGSFLLTSVYFISRAVHREFEVARVQSDFVAAVSHEFRSPLTSMRHMIELLATDRVPDEEARNRFYDVLEREAGRLQRLVEQLLDFRKLDEGAMEFDLRPIDAMPFVEGVAAEFRDEMGAQGCTLEVAGNGSKPIVRGDREALARAVWNLLENASRYSPDCRTVWLEVAELDGNRLAIAVRDRGVGIPQEERDSIFRKFVRGAAARRLGARGTGLGLAMVGEIVRAHGGEISLESEVGQGSTFTIILPLEEPAP